MSKKAFDCVAFVGLGTMGYGMASHLRGCAETVLVWNRTHAKAVKHASQFGSKPVEGLDDLASARVVLTCLPTSTEVTNIANRLLPHLQKGSVFVDCTTGEPSISRCIAETLAEANVAFVDAPVSGGMSGADNGRLTAMVGGPSTVLTTVRPVLDTFCAKIVHCGENIGDGHSVKAINNTLSLAHRLVAMEALLALKKQGVNPEAALDAINASSGRSRATEAIIAQDVLTRKFCLNFSMGLMLKDVRIGTGLLQQHFPQAELLPKLEQIYADGVQAYGPDAEDAMISRYLEELSGVELTKDST